MNDTTEELLTLAEKHRKQISTSLILLGSVTDTLTDLLERVRAGETGVFRDLSKKHAELETLARAARDTERRFDEWYSKQTGELAEGEIDFDQVRDDIGRKLARLAER